MKDYFLEAIIPDDAEGIRPDIAELINKDIGSYREYMIKQYNGAIEKATDEFCFTKFLNEYQVAVNVFDLHSNLVSKRSLNRCIEMCWQIVVHEKDKE